MPVYPRALRAVITQDLDASPVVAVMGARQVGKSFLCKSIADERGYAYRTLDDQDIRRQAIEDPAGLLAELGDGGAFIDEVQRAPDLTLAIKAVVDRDRRPGRYLLSGSNQPKVGRAVSDSLLGRAVYRTLRPFTLSEMRLEGSHPGWSFLFSANEAAVLRELERRAEASGPLPWRDVAATGGFPIAVSVHPERRAQVLSDYATVFASRDIREVIGIDSAERFESFLRLTAARTGQLLNLSGIASDLGIPVTTLRRWMGALERSYLTELVQPYSRNAGNRLIKSAKMFLVDSALALAAAREANPTGFHLETLISSDLHVWRDGHVRRAVSHWRAASGQEVDFVLEESTRPLPLEIKAADNVDSSDARHLRRFIELYPDSPRGVLLSNDPDIRVLHGDVIAAPWWAVI